MPIAGLAATSVLAVQRVVDETTEVPVDPLVRVLEADIEAAAVAADAQAAFDESLDPLAYDDDGFRDRCTTDLGAAYGDVVDTAEWTKPALGTPADPAAVIPARCLVTPRASLGGG